MFRHYLEPDLTVNRTRLAVMIEGVHPDMYAYMVKDRFGSTRPGA